MKHPLKVTNELDRAKVGSRVAADFICRYVWEQYGGKIINLFSNDSSEDRDDLQQIYWLAVAEQIPKLDERGDPIYHLGQRGFWRVGAHIRRKRAMVHLLSLDAAIVDEDESRTRGAMLSDDRVDVEGIVVHQLGSQQQVEMILDIELAPIAQRALGAIMRGEAGDPAEIGFNKTLAKVLKVSPQRASQAMQSLRASVGSAGIEV